MGNVTKAILCLLFFASVYARAADQFGRVWITKPHPSKMCADPTDDPMNKDALKLEKIGVPVFESSIEIDQVIKAANLNCGQRGYFLMTHLVPSAKAAKAKALGYLVTPDNYSHQVAKGSD